MDCLKFYASVKEEVSQRMGEDYQVSLNEIVKNNGVELTGLVIMKNGNNAAPNIYLNEFYEEYAQGRKMEELVDDILEIYQKNRDVLTLDFSFFEDFDQVRPKIMFKLLNYESNQKMLEDVPYVRYMDLAVVFYIMIDHDVIGNGSILIHNNHAKMWQINETTLYETALQNTPQLMQYRFSSMENIVEELFGTKEAEDVLDSDGISEHDMYVLTNQRKLFGASCMMYEGLLKKIAKKLQSNLYIIPSSIHELIILPENVFPYSKPELMEIVKSINATEVEVMDVLSDNVYLYNMNKECIEF